MERLIKKIKRKIIIHAAAVSRPMDLHEKEIERSIKTNIIGTSNVVNLCHKYKIKLIYFSTNYDFDNHLRTSAHRVLESLTLLLGFFCLYNLNLKSLKETS